MAPPSAVGPQTNGHSTPSTIAPHEPGLSEAKAKVQMPKFPGPPQFTDKYEERDYLKGRLAAAFRVFGRSASAFVHGTLANHSLSRQIWLR